MSREEIDAFIKKHNEEAAARGPLCSWEPCPWQLFALPGETHEEYHKRNEAEKAAMMAKTDAGNEDFFVGRGFYEIMGELGHKTEEK